MAHSTKTVRGRGPAHDKPLQRATLAQETGQDPYRSAKRLAEPTVCPDCRAVYEAGRWRRQEALPGATEHVCPACRRMREHNPAGTVALDGPFFREHGAEIMALVRNVSERAGAQYPLQRLMEIDEDATGALVSTTSAHLARAIGRAVDSAWKGELDLDLKAEASPRVKWHR